MRMRVGMPVVGTGPSRDKVRPLKVGFGDAGKPLLPGCVAMSLPPAPRMLRVSGPPQLTTPRRPR